MIRSAILKTLTYSDHFTFPLTAQEIYFRLISPKPCSKERVLRTLQSIVKTHKIEKLGNYYFLPSRSIIVKSRLRHHTISRLSETLAKNLAAKLGKIPFVLAIYLTGSLAMSNSDEDSDIDLMVITQSGRLWTTRLLLTIYTSILGLRRTPHSIKNTGKLCLNLYLTPSSYRLTPDRRSLYTAYELIQAKPIYDPYNTRSALLSANPWIEKYLPNAARTIPKGSVSARPGLAGRSYKPARPGLIGQIVESLSYHLQYLYMKNKITREYVTKDAAFFHPHDPGADVLNKV